MGLFDTIKNSIPGIEKVREMIFAKKARARFDSWSAEDDAKLAFYKQFAGPTDVVFDVGANEGNRTKIFARMAGKVVAVEPQPAIAKLLKAFFAGSSKVIVVQTALGSEVGTAELSVGNVNTVASLSPEWIEAVKATNRFGQMTQWNRKIKVPVTTLDQLIATHGVPAFIKIDVEGFEQHVVAGLSRPVKALSFEFMSEARDRADAVLDRLATFGTFEANFAAGEDLKFLLPDWVSKAELTKLLDGYRNDTTTFGDIYVRFPQAL